MKFNNLFIILLVTLSLGLIVACDSDNNSNAQDMEEPGTMVSCPCNFNEDLWTASGWMVVQEGGLFNQCAKDSETISLQGSVTLNTENGVLGAECVTAIGTANEMDGSLFCEGKISCSATAGNMNETMENLMGDLYFEKMTITQDELTVCQNDVEAVAMTVGLSCQ